MLIGRVDHDPKKSLQAQLRESTLNRLDQYRELYQATFGEKVSTSDLVDLMLNNVMDRDRSFKKFLREQEKLAKEKQQGANQNAASGTEGETQGPAQGNGNPGQRSGPGQQARQA
ncbi:DUF2274 domain-containing protein [Halomonas faecis]|uniref:DUF2274 domain-containing protein n=1 Tax=Halomonas faecis TaxID=1562110 RepID=UPI0013D1146C|nr:DUF2274 domain-containing protein [Halomonas faecis]